MHKQKTLLLSQPAVGNVVMNLFPVLFWVFFFKAGQDLQSGTQVTQSDSGTKVISVATYQFLFYIFIPDNILLRDAESGPEAGRAPAHPARR